MSSGRTLTVAMTGASGAMLTRELLLLLEKDSRVERVHFIASESSLRVLAEELEVSGRNDLIAKLLGATERKDRSACARRYWRAHRQRQLSLRWNDHSSLQHGNARRHRQWTGGQLSSLAPRMSA